MFNHTQLKPFIKSNTIMVFAIFVITISINTHNGDYNEKIVFLNDSKSFETFESVHNQPDFPG